MGRFPASSLRRSLVARDEWYPRNKKIPAPKGHPFNELDKFQGELDWGVIPGRTESEYGDMRAVEYREKFLGRQHEKPFFLALGLWHPHIPMFAPKHYFDLYPPEKVWIPKCRRTISMTFPR